MLRFTILLLVFVALTWPVSMQARCFPVSRLTQGDQAEVLFTDGSPLNVRDGAGTTFKVIATIPEGDVFKVIEGPTCADDINWFHIENPSGWIAEGTEEDGYFVSRIYIGRDEMNARFEEAPVFELPQVEAVEESELTPPTPPETDMKLINMAVNGTQTVWLFSNCQNNFGCLPDTGFVVILRDETTQETREIWRGVPELGLYKISHWREDGNTILLRLDGEAPYPEPGTVPGTDIGYPPEGQLVEIDVQTGEVIEKHQFRAVSGTGKWRVFGVFPSITIEGGETYTVEQENTSFHNLRFSPDETLLVWTETHYDSSFQRESIDLNVMDLNTGEITTVFTFADNYPVILAWLNDSQIRVQVTHIEYTSTVIETVEHDLIFDVLSGDFWRIEQL